MVSDLDLHIGRRLRRRRRLLGLTLHQLAQTIGLQFQQIQKYECGANRVTAARLFDLSLALHVEPGYFFDGLQQKAQADANQKVQRRQAPIDDDVLSQAETVELVCAYYKLSQQRRRRILEFAKALQDAAPESAKAERA